MSERDIHKSIVDYLTVALPSGSVMHHSPNENSHKVQYRVLQKRLGVRAGWPDLEIIVNKTWWRPNMPWSPIFLEIKTATGRQSKTQKQVQAELELSGCAYGVVRSIDDTRDFLLKLIELRHAG